MLQAPYITEAEIKGLPEEGLIGYCGFCVDEINDGNDFVEIQGKLYCEDCAEECQCGKAIPYGKSFCDECLKEECTFDNAFDVSQSVFNNEKAKIKVNVFVEYLANIAGVDINRAVLEYCKQNMLESDLEEYAKDFITSDLSWYKENKEEV